MSLALVYESETSVNVDEHWGLISTATIRRFHEYLGQVFAHLNDDRGR